MNNRIKISSKWDDGGWLIEATVHPDSDEGFPRDAFLWTVAKDGSLDRFNSIGHVDQLSIVPLYKPGTGKRFGVNLVKHDMCRAKMDSEENRDKFIIVLKAAFDNLLTSYEVANIPIEEVYP